MAVECFQWFSSKGFCIIPAINEEVFEAWTNILMLLFQKDASFDGLQLLKRCYIMGESALYFWLITWTKGNIVILFIKPKYILIYIDST